MSDNQPAYPVSMSMSDHDLLIRLDQKMSQLSTDFKDVKDGLANRVAALEAKTVAYEQVMVEYPAAKLSQMIIKHEKWITGFKLTWKVVMTGGVVVGSLVTFFLTLTLGALNILHFK